MKRLAACAFVFLFVSLLLMPPITLAQSQPLPTLTVLASENDHVYFRHVAEEFEREGIMQVEFVPYPSGNRHDFIITRQLAGLSTDIIKTNEVLAGDLLAANLLMDLAGFLERDPVLSIEAFLPGMIQPFTAGDSVFGLPYAIVLRSLRGNITRLDEAGLAHPNALSLAEWTWDAFTEYARKVTLVDGDGTLVRAGIATNQYHFNSMVHQAGGFFFDHPAQPTRSGALLPETIQAVDYWVEWFYPNPIARWGGRLGADNVVFDYMPVTDTYRDIPGDHSFNFITYIETSGDNFFDWDVIRSPMGPRNNAHVDNVESLVVGSNTQHPELAWQLLARLITDRDVARQAIANNARPGGYIPNLELWHNVWPDGSPAGVGIFREIIMNPHFASNPNFPGHGDHNRELLAGLARARAGEVPVPTLLENLDRHNRMVLEQLHR